VAAPWLLFVRHLPGPIGTRLRYRYYRRRLGALGEGVRIDEGVQIVNPEHVFIGAGCWISAGALIAGGPPSTEGREIFRRPNDDFTGQEGELRLGEDIHVGVHAILIGHGGMEVGSNCVIGAGAQVWSVSQHYRGAAGDPGRPSAAAGMRRASSSLVDSQVIKVAPVVVKEESFVAAAAVVLPGVSMGPATWLGPGEVARERLEAGRMYRSPGPDPVG
jgi:acetyltransferase-like isoleucine patch superfamily enzyme